MMGFFNNLLIVYEFVYQEFTVSINE